MDVFGAQPCRRTWTVDDDTPMVPPSASRYEWTGDDGEIGPPDARLEQHLFGDESPSVGVEIDVLTAIPVTLQASDHFYPFKQWAEAGLHPQLLDNIRKCGYQQPMPIQGWCIPPIVAGSDVIAISQTGSGKTTAYLAPIFSRLMGHARRLCLPHPNLELGERVRAEPLVLIMTPTRELCQQIYRETCKLGYRSRLRPCMLYGGAPRREQIQDLQCGADIIIGTPGRIRDIVENEPRALSLRRLKFTVLDEADELLQGDWDDQMAPILLNGAAQHDGDHQFLLFSATFPPNVREAASAYLETGYTGIHMGRIGSTHRNVHQTVFFVEKQSKNDALLTLLKEGPRQLTMVFCNTGATSQAIDHFLIEQGFNVGLLCAGLPQHWRDMMLERFRRGQIQVLVSTPVGARGIDIPGIRHVINYDLPSVDYGGITEYVHRIGRTGRIGNLGQATSFFNNHDEGLGPDLVRTMRETDMEIPDFLQQYLPEYPSSDNDTDFGDSPEDDSSRLRFRGNDAWTASNNVAAATQTDTSVQKDKTDKTATADEQAEQASQQVEREDPFDRPDCVW